jgi:hypothetical protein
MRTERDVAQFKVLQEYTIVPLIRGSDIGMILFRVYLLRGLSPQSELYRPSYRRLSAKLVPTSADRGCNVISVTDPYGRILGFLNRAYCVNPIDNTH